MRLACLFACILLLLGVSAAQQPSSNFSVGPQYVITGSPELARPIQTPSMSLDAPLPPIPGLPEIGPVVTNQPYIPNPEIAHQADLFPIYYGYPQSQVVEIVSEEPTPELPASIVNPGVTGVASAQSLREHGYGVPLGDAAAYWKTHKLAAPHMYTNADVERLRGN